jgi:hypothetical protein
MTLRRLIRLLAVALVASIPCYRRHLWFASHPRPPSPSLRRYSPGVTAACLFTRFVLPQRSLFALLTSYCSLFWVC